MMDFRTPRGIAAIMVASGLAGLFAAVTLTDPPEAESGGSQQPTEWRLPELREPGEGMDLIRSLTARAPWGGRLAEAGSGANRQRNGAGNRATGQSSAESVERQVAKWRYLGSVRRGGVTRAVFLDQAGEIVHLELGSRLHDTLDLAVLEADHVVFESADGGRSIRLQLFGQTALEIEGRPVPDEAPESSPGEDRND